MYNASTLASSHLPLITVILRGCLIDNFNKVATQSQILCGSTTTPKQPVIYQLCIYQVYSGEKIGAKASLINA